jgi:hypothetical protein
VIRGQIFFSLIRVHAWLKSTPLPRRSLSEGGLKKIQKTDKKSLPALGLFR